MMAKRDRPARGAVDEVFLLWPSRPVLAEEIGARAAQVDKWAHNDRIPAEWQYWICQAAKARKFAAVTPEWMLKHHSQFAKREVAQ